MVYYYNMKIDNRTKTKDVLPLLTQDNIECLLDDVSPILFYNKPVIGMTIEEFSEVLDEKSVIERLLSEEYFIVFLGKLKDYRTQMKELNTYLKKFELYQTPEQKAAAQGIIFPDLIQRMLLTCAKFFHFKSFEEAQQSKVCDYLLIMQDEASSAQYQQNYQKIMEQKWSTLKKH